jgi:antirestriction protein ArdC
MKKTAPRKTGQQVRSEIQTEMTERIVAALKLGKAPWRKPWATDPNAGRWTNIHSKKMYRGINVLLLECTAMDMGFNHRWWGTYKQWADLGCQVKKRPEDAKYWGTRIVFWEFKEIKSKDDDEDGEKKTPKKVPFLRTYVVFNLEQVDDPDGKLAKYRIDEKASALIDPKAVDDPIFDMAKEVIAGTKADIRHGGDRAFYRLPTPYEDWPKHTEGDWINVPEPAMFVSPADYYYTNFHELGHWSEVRLGQKDEKYAFNELVAEMASCFLAQACAIPQSQVMDNHERYLAHWLQAMGGDPSFIFKASSAATKATDLILSYSGHQEAVGNGGDNGGDNEDDEQPAKPKGKSRKAKAA